MRFFQVCISLNLDNYLINIGLIGRLFDRSLMITLPTTYRHMIKQFSMYRSYFNRLLVKQSDIVDFFTEICSKEQKEFEFAVIKTVCSNSSNYL